MHAPRISPSSTGRLRAFRPVAALLLIVLSSMLVSGLPAHADTSSGLQGWWKLDEGSGTTAADSSGSGNDGTLSSAGDGLPSWVSGQIGPHALDFYDGSGAQGFLNIPVNSNTQPETVSVSFWARAESLPPNIVGVMYNSGDGNNGFELFETSSGILGWAERGNFNTNTTSYTFTANQWVLVTFVYDPSAGVKMYANADLVGSDSTTGAMVYATSPVQVGSRASIPLPFYGSVDDVRIYDRVLSAQDVDDLYNQVTPPSVSAQSATSISVSGATLNGSVTDTGSTTVTAEGFSYGTTTSYGLSASSTGSFGAGAFSQVISGLSCGTAYHYQAFAVNAEGIATSPDQAFSTLACLPSVSTQAAASVTSSGAVMNGSIDSVGGSDPSARGFVYGTSAAYGATTTENGSFSPGSYSASVSSLLPNTAYHFAAYAINSGGPAYGADTAFTTGAAPVVSNSAPSAPSGRSGSSAASQLANLRAIYAANNLPCPESMCGPLEDFVASSANQDVSAAAFVFRDNQRLGNSNPDIKALQAYLNAHGHALASTGAGSPGHETQYFGSLTDKALVKFQKDHGISATGFFGPITRAYVNSH